MIITKKMLPRRTVLRGLGVSLALPLLDCMIPALTPLVKTAAAPIKRLGIVYFPNGMEMNRWTPKTTGSAFEFTPILKPLEPYRDRLLVLGGLRSREADGRGTDGVGDHSRASGVFLTGVHIKKTEGADIQAGISMDQIAAREIGVDTQLGSLEVTLEPVDFVGSCDPGYSCAYSSTLCWRGPTTPLPMESNPRVVFERLFGSTASTDPVTRRAGLERDRSLLDSVQVDVFRLQRSIGAKDHAKLTDYLESVREIERRIAKAEEQLSRELPSIEQPEGIPVRFDEHAKLMFNLLAIAYQADITRVFTLMFARELSSRTYPEAGVAESHHGISHHQNAPEKLDGLARTNTYHMSVVAMLLEKLASIDDGEGTLLDHAAILCGGGISDSDLHLHKDLPVFVAGGAGGQMRGGRFIELPAETPLTNLQLTLLEKVGVRVEQLGDSTGRLDLLSDI